MSGITSKKLILLDKELSNRKNQVFGPSKKINTFGSEICHLITWCLYQNLSRSIQWFYLGNKTLCKSNEWAYFEP